MVGYNIAFKVNEKTFCGRTQDDLTVAARLKESLTKDDAGESQQEVVGHDVTVRCAGIVVVGSSETTKLDRDDILALALAKGSAAQLPCKYIATGGDTYSGTAIITNYSESSSAQETEDATYSIDVTIKNFAKVTAG